MAQTTSQAATTSTSKQDKAAIAAQKKADKEAKALAKKQAKEAKASTAKTSIVDKKAAAHKKKTDKEAKALAKKQAKEAKGTTTANTTAAHLNKNGTPDKRFKANKQPKVTTQAPESSPTQTGATTDPSKMTKSTSHVAHTNTAKTHDKSIGTDAKGRTIYQGPRGGKYYITKNGNKEYVK